MQTEHPGRIALQSDIAEELHMEGDAARIHQLVSLLVDNAVKYTPEGGKIHIFWRKNGKKAEFSVQNTCDTLPEGDLNRLFDRFYRADASRARESGGYGIGLSVAAAIVKAHKGKITAERTRDGTCFESFCQCIFHIGVKICICHNLSGTISTDPGSYHSSVNSVIFHGFPVNIPLIF